MSKYVSDTAAGKSISAWIVLRKGKHVATIRAHFGNSRVLVNVFDFAPGEQGFQSGSASGYGYDKFTAALDGLTVDGNLLTDHARSHGAPKPPRGMTGYPDGFKVPKGYTLANYRDGQWQSCFRLSGLDYLTALGYTVIKAI